MNQTLARKMSAPVVIIGGGIMGCATAYYLARRGVKAVVLEKTHVAAAASGRNAGGVRAHCRDRRERPLALASIALWQQLEAELAIPIGYQQTGNLRLAATAERLQQLATEGQEEATDGLAVEMWDQQRLRREAPYLGAGFIGGKYCPTDGTADPVRTTTAFAWAAQQLGATILPQTEATAIQQQAGQVTAVVARQPIGDLSIETEQVLHAAGPWSANLAATLGIQLPLRPIRLTIGATAPVQPLFRPFLSAHDLGIAARPTNNGQIYVSGFGESEPTFSTTVPAAAVAELRAIDRLVPALAGVPFVHAWSGLLNVTPDEVPIIDSVANVKGYLIATGFSGHGFCLGPIIGKLMAEWLVDGQPSLDLTPFRLDRFSPAQLQGKSTGPSSVIAGRLQLRAG